MRHVQRRSSSEKVRRVGLLGLRRGCVTLLAGLAALALVLAACAPEEGRLSTIMLSNGEE
jgi:hypothetical protein